MWFSGWWFSNCWIVLALNTQQKDAKNKLKNKEVRYLHYDALSSVDMISDGYGLIVERRSYDTWGKQRKVAWRHEGHSSVVQASITNRGYTGHEEITEVGLTHMNGRVYDSELGRFLSADPVIQAPFITNSFNRYSYVMNNPLKYVDPTGYRWNAPSRVGPGGMGNRDPLGRGEPGSHKGGSGAVGGNGRESGRNNSESRSKTQENLKDGLGFTIGYIARAIGGIFGGEGNTLDDQVKMSARSAITQCRSGHCGENQLRRIGAAADRFGRSSSFNRSWNHWADGVSKGHIFYLSEVSKVEELSAAGIGTDFNVGTYGFNYEVGYYKSITTLPDGTLRVTKGFYYTRSIDSIGWNIGPIHFAVYNNQTPKDFFGRGTEVSGGNVAFAVSGTVPEKAGFWSKASRHTFGFEVGPSIPGAHIATTQTGSFFEWETNDILD